MPVFDSTKQEAFKKAIVVVLADAGISITAADVTIIYSKLKTALLQVEAVVAEDAQRSSSTVVNFAVNLDHSKASQATSTLDLAATTSSGAVTRRGTSVLCEDFKKQGGSCTNSKVESKAVANSGATEPNTDTSVRRRRKKGEVVTVRSGADASLPKVAMILTSIVCSLVATQF